MKTPITMPAQPADKRINNFNEVSLGLDKETAITEAKRCIQCKNPKCVSGCPVSINIPAFIKKLAENDIETAFSIIKEANDLPAICGRVCPQEQQCEKECILSNKDNPIKIGYLERFIADHSPLTSHLSPLTSHHSPLTSHRSPLTIAVIGSGPSSLACAGELCRKEYNVTIFEAFHKPGGVLSYGIPEFRLPKEIVAQEIKNLEKMGVTIKLNHVIGRIKTLDQLLLNEFKAIFIGVGAGIPKSMKIPGENLGCIYFANEFLTRINLMKAYKFPEYDTPIITGKTIAVIGGGNTAMDAARSAKRLKEVKNVYIIYRRTENEMPARAEEIEHAKEEGIKFITLANPLKYISDNNHNVSTIKCIKMQLDKPDDSGRQRPVPIKDSEFELEINSAVVAIGTNANPLLAYTTPDLKVNDKGYIIVDEKFQTSKSGVFAGGDIVTGAATVIKAMGAGKQAAKNICQYLGK